MIQNKCQQCGKLLEFETEFVGTSCPCPFCDKETLLLRPSTFGQLIIECLVFLVSAPVGVLWLFYLLSLPFTTYSFAAFLDSTAVGSLYLFSIGGAMIAINEVKPRNILLRISIGIWTSILGGIMGVIFAIVVQFLISWPIWIFKKLFGF